MTAVASTLGWVVVPILLVGAALLLIWSQKRVKAATLAADASLPPLGSEGLAILRGHRKLVVLGAPIVVLLAVQGIALTRHWVGKNYKVLSCNMAPTLLPGDRVIVESASNRARRGDIVYFIPPPAERRSPDDLRVSRLVGFPGDRIEALNGHLVINGSVSYEADIPREMPLFPFTATVPRGSYFVLGDNRTNSKDSRAFGPVAHSDIRYRAIRIRKSGGRSPQDCVEP